MEGEYQLGLPYYRMAGIQPNDALKRVSKIQQQSNIVVCIVCHKHQPTFVILCLFQSTKGLLYYLKSVLLDPKFNNDLEKLFATSSKQSFVESVLELCENHYFDDLPKLVLKCSVLREYFVERIAKILSQKVSK